MQRLLVIAAALAGLAPGVAAQRPDTTMRDTVYLLAPVTVTGRSTHTSLDLPLAITRVEMREVFGKSGYGVNDALGLVPGVVAQSRYGTGDVRITIRGFGARGAGDRSNAGTTRGIRVLVDGFPETEPDGRTSLDGLDLAAAEAVEVVRSNASSLWGNAAGGVVYVSTLPSQPRNELSLEGLSGSYGLQRLELRGTQPFGEGVFSISGVRTDFEGWRAHSQSERTVVNLGVTTSWGAATRLGAFALASSNQFRIPGPLTQTEVDADPRQANGTYLARDERRFNRTGRLGVTLDRQIAEGHAVSGMLFVNPKFLQRSERGTFRDFTRYHIGGNAVYRFEHSVGPSVGSTLTAGADEAYQDGAILFYSLTPEGTRGAQLRDNKREGANNVGVFLQEELALGSRVLVSAGARYDAITYYYQSFINPALDGDRAFTRATPKLGVTYRLTPTHTLYLNIGGGVEAPAGNETDPASTFGQDTVYAINPLLEPIRSTTYEVGTKQIAAFQPGQPLVALTYDAALYYTDVRNEIIPYRGGRFYFTAGRVRRLGGELGLKLQAAAGVSLQAALAYSHHQYTDYLVDSVHYGRPGQYADYSGNRVVGVPEWTYGTALTYDPPALRYVEARFEVQGMSRYYADDANTVGVPAYRIANATVGLSEPIAVGELFDVRGFVTVTNLLDRRYIGSAFLNPDVVGSVPVAFEPGLPRTVAVSFSVGRR